MITMPSEQPIGSIFYITRRPDIFMECCAPCEEVLAGPFDDMREAMRMTPIVRGWLKNLDPWAAIGGMGILCFRPTLTNRPEITPRFDRSTGECILRAGGTRLPATWILQHAAERRESLSGHVAAGFSAEDERHAKTVE